MNFRQLYDDASSTYTYLIADRYTKEAVLIDPVATHISDYVALLSQLGCRLKYSIETHVHADHVTAGGLLRERLGAETAVSQRCGAVCADHQLRDGDILRFGEAEEIAVIATPGHTPGSVSYLWRERLFTGDSLLINGCGRTDFQDGDAGTLYDTIAERLFRLPGETLVYPGHDYHGYWVSSIQQERSINPRLADKTREQFIAIMHELKLAKPRLIDQAVRANRLCGLSQAELRQG